MMIERGVAPTLATALARRGYEKLTPVQDAMLASELAGQDLLVSAQTGSGKTVAFGLAIAPDVLDADQQKVRPSISPSALIVAPTRELALQVKQELIWLYQDADAFIGSCVGGMDYRSEIRTLERGAQIVVGTPGRLVDHINRGTLDLSSLRVAVLDEADEMLDLGFREELEAILSEAPETRRTLMFSATVSKGIQRLAENFQNNAQRVNLVSDSPQHADIDYRVHLVKATDQDNAIFNVLRFHDARNAIVFCSTRANVSHLSARLTNRGFSTVSLSGELSQKERSQALQAMRDGRARVCVATDVAARGIDLPGLELVIHADLPRNSEALLHRSGRTGRAGRKGVSVLIGGARSAKRVTRLLQDAGIRDSDWGAPPSADEVRARDEERLLADGVFLDPVDPENEADLVARLIELHGPEKLAAAFLRIRRETMAAPEDVSSVDAEPDNRRSRRDRDDRERPPRKPRPVREDFVDGQWVKLTIGRRANAEPRWLLPMLCKAGGLERKDIGAIRIEDRETFVELAPDSVERFMGNVGPGAVLEKSIEVSLSDKPAAAPASESAATAQPPRSDKKKKPGKRVDVTKDKPLKLEDLGLSDSEFDALPRSFKARHKSRSAKQSSDRSETTGSAPTKRRPATSKPKTKPSSKPRPGKPKYAKASGPGGKGAAKPRKRPTARS